MVLCTFAFFYTFFFVRDHFDLLTLYLKTNSAAAIPGIKLVAQSLKYNMVRFSALKAEIL